MSITEKIIITVIAVDIILAFICYTVRDTKAEQVIIAIMVFITGIPLIAGVAYGLYSVFRAIWIA